MEMRQKQVRKLHWMMFIADALPLLKGWGLLNIVPPTRGVT